MNYSVNSNENKNVALTEVQFCGLREETLLACNIAIEHLDGLYGIMSGMKALIDAHENPLTSLANVGKNLADVGLDTLKDMKSSLECRFSGIG